MKKNIKKLFVFIIIFMFFSVIDCQAWTLNGIETNNGKTYIYKIGILQKGLFTYKSNTYYSNEDGVVQTGFQQTDKGIMFFSNDKTKYGVRKTGKLKIGDNTYIFNPTLQIGLFTYDSNTYYSNEDGKILTGFQQTEQGTMFFSNDKTKYGIMRTGKFLIGNDYYIFNPTLQTRIFTYEKNKYYANENGKILTGFQQTEEGTMFFSNDKTRYGVMRTGKFQIGNNYYIFNPTLQTGMFTYNNDNYYADDTGKLYNGFKATAEGIIFLSSDRTKYGVMRTGKFQIGNDYYVFNPTLQTGLFTYNNDKYYANDDGKLYFGFQETENGTIFLSRDRTRYGVMRTGTFNDGYIEYNLDDNGILISKQYLPYYYNQYDPRWAYIKYGKWTFGSTGCAPTSMAMAFTSILGRQILPNEVGDFLYYGTNEYNKVTAGSSGMAIKYATEHYGVKMTPVYSKDQMIQALKDGYIVFAAMGNGKFATTRYNHAILLYRYDNNRTVVMAADPLKVENNDWVSIDQVLNEQSSDPDDSTAGSNFYILSRF